LILALQYSTFHIKLSSVYGIAFHAWFIGLISSHCVRSFFVIS